MTLSMAYPWEPIASAEQMQRLEQWMFDRGLPVAALMEKAAIAVAQRLVLAYPQERYGRVGVLVGPGHNGGDGLVIARELHLQGYDVRLWVPFNALKPLTQSHYDYAQALGIPTVERITDLENGDLGIDALFGLGLTRPLTGAIAVGVDHFNQFNFPKVSIDMPSGLHTNTGAVLGTAVKAQRSYCLGLWKRVYAQDGALPYIGQGELVPIGIPAPALTAIFGPRPPLNYLTDAQAIAALPIHRSPLTHKYHQGHGLFICGSQAYSGAAVLTALGARASGVGMVTLIVPQSLKALLNAQCPEALVMGCPETSTGAISQWPDLDFSRYSAIVIGPGLGLLPPGLMENLLEKLQTFTGPLVLDADGLNQLAQGNLWGLLPKRPGPTVLTPHPGEFKRLFPDIDLTDRLQAVVQATQHSQTFVLLKGAKTAIASPAGNTWIIKNSTPALARGGSGDVLSGLLGGILAQPLATSEIPWENRIAAGAWWHAQAALEAQAVRTPLGVDPYHLSQFLLPTLQKHLTP